jgi:hypothetical protein
MNIIFSLFFLFLAPFTILASTGEKKAYQKEWEALETSIRAYQQNVNIYNNTPENVGITIAKIRFQAYSAMAGS